MNHIASTLGVSLPLFSLSARDAVMRTTSTCSTNSSTRLSKRPRDDSTSSSFFAEHRDSLLCVKYGNKGNNKEDVSSFDCVIVDKDNNDDDDDNNTVGTLSSCDDTDDSFSSTCSSMCTVSFAAQVVTQVHYRPRTLPEEKATLFYTDVEYRQFRRDFCYGTSTGTRRGSIVKFAPQIVSSVWTYSDTANKEAMFYSESDLQRFLDEFVSSLNGNNVVVDV